MPKRNLHLKPFDESTCEKLGLYREYLREWLPVFIHNQHIDSIQVFDFFTGPGRDIDGTSGSPLITCEKKLPKQAFHVSYGAGKTTTTEAIKHFEGV
jgi:three-Cys-motif partner protein